MFEENNSIDQLYLRRINSSPNTNNVTLLVLLTVLAVSVCCIACFCVQFFRSIVNRPRPETTEDNPSSLVREGIIANMTPRQRRAVLETFFSDTSNKEDSDKEKKVDTFKKKKSLVNRLTENFKRETLDESVGSGVEESSNIITNIPNTPRTIVDLESDLDDFLQDEKLNTMNDCSLFLKLSSESDSSKNFDYLEEHHDENSSQGRACAICLDEYVNGDEVIQSKHCCHCFHKECIFQWLENHDSCPCCRNNMVTKEDIQEAAEAVVGKQTMYSAVQQFSSNHQAIPSPPRRLNGLSPTILRTLRPRLSAQEETLSTR